MMQRLLGELIGLARATDGNEHLISPSSTAAVAECLAASREELSGPRLEALLRWVEEEKRKMVPNCFCCAAPCGKTSAYDLRLLEREDTQSRQLKQQLLSEIAALAAQGRMDAPDVFYQSLIAVGIEGIDIQILESLLAKIHKLS